MNELEVLADEMTSCLYKRYGTDSGILFGIKSRLRVFTIVRETIKNLDMKDMIKEVKKE